MDTQLILEKATQAVKETLAGDSSGHDWWHIYRVRNIALTIGKEEKADLFIVELGALLHDIADYKFHDGDDTVGPRVAKEILEKAGADEQTITHIQEIISHISYKGAGVATPMETLEGKVVQDADRLDAIGAIGIGRTFTYGGHKGKAMYNPEEQIKQHNSFEDYKKNPAGSTIHHFYEKLLLLKDRMNTETAKKLAEGRHAFMEKYLEEFYAEWEGAK
jgi:uncharacterized protein